MTVYAHQDTTFGYTQESMITYIFLVAILQSIVITTPLHNLAGEVYSGDISKLLVKPLGLFRYLAAREVADKLLNISFVILETVALYFIFKPNILLPNFEVAVVFAFWTLGAIILHFFISVLFGAIGFWSPNAWGPKFLFFMIIEFTIGKLFPLDIFPDIIQKILYATPLPYLAFAQTQLFMGRIAADDIMPNTVILLFWIIVLYLVTITVWRKGLRDYAATGH